MTEIYINMITFKTSLIINGRKLNRYDKTQKVNLTKRRFDKVNSLEVYKKEIKMSCISNKDNGDFKKSPIAQQLHISER